ncbi:MAG TPA: type II toxin-antitoxin system Phd/YefM family antitoxin [Thermoanaerobaculia bacterium]|jgi:prevent-host-death family protein
MKIAPVAEVKAHFSEYVKETENGPVVVTRNGRPAAVMIAAGEDEDELERLLLAYSPRFREVLRHSREQIRQSGGVGHDAFWDEVDR